MALRRPRTCVAVMCLLASAAADDAAYMANPHVHLLTLAAGSAVLTNLSPRTLDRPSASPRLAPLVHMTSQPPDEIRRAIAMLSEAEFEALLERLNTDANGKSALRNLRADSAVLAEEPLSAEDELVARLIAADPDMARVAADPYYARMSKEVEARKTLRELGKMAGLSARECHRLERGLLSSRRPSKKERLGLLFAGYMAAHFLTNRVVGVLLCVGLPLGLGERWPLMQKLGWQAARLDKIIGRCLMLPFGALFLLLERVLDPEGAQGLWFWRQAAPSIFEVLEDDSWSVGQRNLNARKMGLLNDQVMEQRRKMLDEQLEGGSDDVDDNTEGEPY